MELHEALSQISEIRQQMARAEVFRGYRSATAAFSGVVAIGAAVGQSIWLPHPMNDAHAYMYLWAGVALLCMAVAGLEMGVRYRRTGSQLQRQMTTMAVEQFAPAIVAGALFTLAIAKFTRDDVWLLPALWSLLFAMGIFASRKFLPRPASWVGRYYLLASLLCVVLAQGERALSPWAMGLSFGGGQLLAAGVLYWSLERRHA